ncbi:MAG TPA: hypothetical protein ENJ95_18965 [Bacteroidetes bacterium]|nr:hypothetical protein [Bacteroidota bacterium]
MIPLTMLCLLMAISIMSAQSHKKLSISTSIGIVPTYTGKNVKTEVPPLSIHLDYKLSNNFSLGAYAGYTAATSKPRLLTDGIVSQVENKTANFALRGAFHRDMTDKLAIHGGILLGYSAFNTKEMDADSGEKIVRERNVPSPYDPDAPKGQPFYAGFVGGKYSLGNVASLTAEIGGGTSIVSFGLSFSIK